MASLYVALFPPISGSRRAPRRVSRILRRLGTDPGANAHSPLLPSADIFDTDPLRIWNLPRRSGGGSDARRV